MARRYVCHAIEKQIHTVGEIQRNSSEAMLAGNHGVKVLKEIILGIDPSSIRCGWAVLTREQVKAALNFRR